MTHLANYFSDQGYNVVYGAIRENGYYPLNDNIEVKIFKNNDSTNGIDDIRNLRTFLKKNQFSAIIAFGYTVSIKIAFASIGLKCRKKIIMSERNDPARNVNSLITNKLRSWAYSTAQAVVFQTEDARRFFSKKIQKKGKIILNPLFVDNNADGIKRDKKRIIAVGRITTQKNFIIMLKAFKLFSGEFPDYYLDIYGEPDNTGEYDRLTKYISENNLLDKVKFKGFSNKIANEYYGCRIYLSSSDYEGLSNSMLEAMACGLIVICTDCPCGGARMVINDGENGYLVPVGGYQQMYNTLKKVANDESESEKIVKNTVKIRKQLDISNIGKQWSELINQL